MTSYTPEQRQQAVARAVVVGSKQTAAEMGIPRRTVSSWIGGETRARELMPIVTASREQMGERFWSTIERGVAVLAEKLDDPKARLSDVARALEVAINAHSLLTGRPTSRTENLNVNIEPTADWSVSGEQERAGAAFLDELLAMSDEDLDQWGRDGGLKFLKSVHEDAARLLTEGGTPGVG